MIKKPWRRILIEEAEDRGKRAEQNAIEYTAKRVAKIHKATELKKRLINHLREKPEQIFGSDDIYIRTKNHLLAHDVSKELGIELKRTAERDGFNFKAEYEGIKVCVFGMQTIPHCKIVPHKEMREVTIYETVCNEE